MNIILIVLFAMSWFAAGYSVAMWRILRLIKKTKLLNEAK